MNNTKILSESTISILACPNCKGTISASDNNKEMKCQNSSCSTTFPVIDGLPVLINESNSVFSIGDFTTKDDSDPCPKRSKTKSFLRNSVPSITNNFKAKDNYKILNDLLNERDVKSRVLIIGAGNVGKGIDQLLNNEKIDTIESDVSTGSRTMIILDSHDIPFKDESFDAIIFQAVLEHVINPSRCIEEAFRVLKKDGLIYSETPFMQQVHMGPHDFTRFTHLGHRHLFNHFKEIESGPLCGPGTALAWSYTYFLLSFAESKTMRSLIRSFAHLTSFHLKYFDRHLSKKAGAYDASSAFYFLGQKSNDRISDIDLLKEYKGAV